MLNNTGELSALGMLGLTILMIIAIATFLPSLGVIVRRLHDRDRSGWFYFISLIPLIGGIWLLYEFFSEGTQGINSYGDDPKRPQNEISEIGTPQE